MVFAVPVTVAVKPTFPPAVTVAEVGVMLTPGETFTVTMILADAPGLATLVAVTVKVCVMSRLVGAVYSPKLTGPLLIVPVAALPPVVPLTLQVTAVFALPVTEAVNCSMPPRLTIGVGDIGGEVIVTTTGGGAGAMVIKDVATSVGSATLVAVNVTVAGLGTPAGAK
jgi:hypothetical protein